MSKKEVFISLYEAHLEFENSLDALENLGINFTDAFLTNAFYKVFEAALKLILTPEGEDILFQDILYRGMTIEEAVGEIEKYLIDE